MFKVLSLKEITSNPADGVSNFMKAIFGESKDQDFVVLAHHNGIPPAGALRDIKSSIWLELFKKPDILWGTGHPKEIFYLLFKPRETKYVITFHSVLFRGDEGGWKVRTPWWLRRFIFEKASLVICPSEFSANSVRKLLPSVKAISILNGVRENLFSPARENGLALESRYSIKSGDRPIVSFVGSMHARKRPELVVELAAEMPDVRFIMVGRETEEFDIRKAADENKNIIWIPKMPREDIAILLASSSAMIFPSINDASAAVILEAMASGCVPVVSASGGSAEFFTDNKNGFAIPVGNREKEEFKNKINLILTDGLIKERMSKAAREEAEGHSWSKVSRQYIEAIESI